MSSIGHLNLSVRALCREGRLKEALHILLNSQNTNVDSCTYLHLLHACIANKALSEGKQIHSHINDRAFTFPTTKILQNKIINMYDKCGSLDNARDMFDKMTEPDVSSWNTIIAAYRRWGFLQEALTMFHKMQGTCVQFDEFTFSLILPVCAKLRVLEKGMEIHQKVMKCGFLADIVVQNALIDMYARCGSIREASKLFGEMSQRSVVSWNVIITGFAQNGDLDEALRLFEEMPQRDVVSWTAIIVGCVQNGFVVKALELFEEMQLAGVKPNSATFASILPACAKTGALEQGMEIHREIVQSRLLWDVVVANALIDMYAKCGRIQKARDVFDKMPQRNVVSWNAIITGYAQNNVLDEALRLFKEMSQRDVVSWTAIIAGYARNGLVETALEVFKEMLLAGLKPNSAVFVNILTACAQVGSLKEGMEMHQKVIKYGFLSDVVVANVLIDMYAKCGSIRKAGELFDKLHQRNAISWTAMITGYAQNGVLDEALRLFKEMPQQDAVSWNAMIAGYAQNGLAEKALEIFKQMQSAGVIADSSTFASILPACAKIGALEQGTEIHKKIIQSGLLSDVVDLNALIDMYAKCGSIQKAHKLFDKMPKRNVVSWSTMIAGYGMNGYGKDALELFRLMKQYGTKPNHITFVCVLFACSQAGLVDDGCKYFEHMIDYYCIMPTMEHFVCMVDLLGRAGYLEEAFNFIIKMPLRPSVVVWTCLLGTCTSHKNMQLGEFVGTHLFDLDPTNSATYVLLSNSYAEMGRWNDVQNVRKLMNDRGIKKIPGCSWIEDHRMAHAFCVGDRSYPRTQKSMQSWRNCLGK